MVKTFGKGVCFCKKKIWFVTQGQINPPPPVYVCLHARVSRVIKPAYGLLFSRIECILLVMISSDLTSHLQL